MILKACIFFFLCTYVNAFAGHVTEHYPHKTVLSTGNYTLYWKVNTTTIVFEAHVRTHGWVGLGFSNDGMMFPGDAVIGYVNDAGKGMLTDYHTVGHRPPVEDTQQDYTLIASRQVNTGTMVKFSRPLISTDAEDMALKPGSTHVIWAYGDSDPTPTELKYHGNNRDVAKAALTIISRSKPSKLARNELQTEVRIP